MKVRTNRFFFLLIAILYACAGLLTIIGFLAPYFSVNSYPFFQFSPIAAMYLLPVHLTVGIFLSLQSRRWLPLALLCFSLSSLILLNDYNWQSPENEQQDSLRVVSFNVRTFSYNLSNVDSVAQLLKALKPDVVCLQEFRNNQLQDSVRALQYLSQALGLPYYRFTLLPIHIQGGAIFSRYPITAVDTLYMSAEEINSGILATIASPEGVFGVGNIHMSSFRIEGTLKKYPRWRDKLEAIHTQALKTLHRQQEKTYALLEKTNQYPHPLILTADMNSVAHTRITTQLTRHFRDSFRQKGEGIGWSYPVPGFTGLRIDYQFVSEEWEILEHKVIPSGISDHYPILGVYRLKPNP